MAVRCIQLWRVPVCFSQDRKWFKGFLEEGGWCPRKVGAGGIPGLCECLSVLWREAPCISHEMPESLLRFKCSDTTGQQTAPDCCSLLQLMTEEEQVGAVFDENISGKHNLQS